LDLALAGGFNVIAGPNAQGKTNLLEALYLISTARLLRGQRDAEAIQEGYEDARVEADVENPHSTIAVQLHAGQRKRALLNGHGLPRASDLLGRLPSVCVSSEDLSLARGEPSDRRLFLDVELSALYGAYLRDLAAYKRALEHRNALIRLAGEQHVDDATFEPWEIELAEYGSRIRRARIDYVQRLNDQAAACHAMIAASERLVTQYAARDDADGPEELLGLLAAKRGNDIRRSGTSVGPHRDELLFTIEGRDVRLYGSQGQQRSCTIAVKLGSLRVAEQVNGVVPLLLLDDVFSDLDASRRAALISTVLELAEQTVLTCTEAAAAGPRILEQARIFEVRNGQVTLDEVSS
jgi:DNA replication and repair protein RecF